MGPWDTIWTFPSNKTLRFQDFEVTVTTVDGKKAVLQGQVPFRFVGEADPEIAKKFAVGLGARKYNGERPGVSNEGWENMLNQLLVPEIRATLKETFGRVYCADFEPSCRAIDPRANVPTSNPEAVYAAVAKALQQRVDRKLGDSYLRDLGVRVNSITLPREVQSNIDQVTTEQAKTKRAEQSEVTARAEAKAITTKAKALRKNPSSILLEVAKECNNKCTIVLDGSKGGVNATVGK
jgi:regulator of protease activity HflC (stomatin/prohibitin superfamily)